MMPEDRAKPVLRFEGVTVAFEGVPALQDVSFAAAEGETRVILGAAGSGKTVLLKTALGLVQPDKGRVYVLGRDMSRMREEERFELRSRMGMLFQESALFDSLTIEENVAYPLRNQKSIQCPEDEVRPRVEEALNFVELGATLEKMPSELSGGMRRRAAIARAVVTQPPLLLYDSPTAGLDPITAQTIIALILKERDLNRTTSLIVTHRYQDGNLLANFRYDPKSESLVPADHDVRTCFMVLKEGRVLFEGNQAELEASTDPYIAKFYKRRE
ncbi:MAG TPA: ATP-binding cassette domain-containing protein [Bryobacteraceae bacterium]|nr:ATP-binding cassette domain-containing protein [Bryobacteraceae bacterium]